jgi:hypothetical protein
MALHMSTPSHPLCRVHTTEAASASALVIWDGRCGALVGSASAIARCFRRIYDSDDVEISWSAIAFPGLTPDHPRQILVMPVEVSSPEPDFMDFHNGAFYIPKDSTIERSPSGSLCVFRAEPERHTHISTQPVGLN